MPIGDVPRTSPANQALIFPYAADVTVPVAPNFAKASTTAIGIPRVLVSYYDQRITAQLVAELQNAEASFAPITPAFTPLNGAYLGQCGGAGSVIERVAGPLVDLSDYFRSGQPQFFGVFARQVEPGKPTVARNYSLVLYLGSITIGRQE